MKRLGWVGVIAAFLLISVFGFGMLSRQGRPAQLPAGEYTNITGNTALACGLVAAGQLSRLPVFLGSYPITPASDILHELAKNHSFGVITFQAEDEIAGIGSAIGAAYGALACAGNNGSNSWVSCPLSGQVLGAGDFTLWLRFRAASTSSRWRG